MPPTEVLQYVEYGTIPNARGGGYELVVDPFLFEAAESAISQWQPDVLLVMDPEMFMFDAFRIPGFNSLVLAPKPPPPGRPVRAPPVTIGCFTTFYVDGVYKLPDFWWMPRFARSTLDMGVATAYGHFDHVFVNGETTATYLRPMAVEARAPDPPIMLRERVRVVGSRGVAKEFCDTPPADECGTIPAAVRVRDRPPGTLALVYVGRLAFDKSVDEMLAAHVKAMQRLNWPPACLYVIGAGELEGAVREIERKHPAHVAYLGTVAHQHVSCVLREANVYVTAAPNETYGRAMVEGMRCSLPVVGLDSCNLHVKHEHNGLLATDYADLTDQMIRALTEPQLMTRLAANARTVGHVIAGAEDPNKMMLDAIIEAHAVTSRAQPHRQRPWHWLWSFIFSISLWIDDPPEATVVVAVAIGAVAAMACCVWACCCRCCRREHAAAAAKATTKRPKRD